MHDLKTHATHPCYPCTTAMLAMAFMALHENLASSCYTPCEGGIHWSRHNCGLTLPEALYHNTVRDIHC